MAITYTIDAQRSRIFVTITGPATVDDLLALMDHQADEQAWAYSMLYDLRATAYAPTQQEVEALLGRVRTISAKHGPRGPVALVAAQPETFGVGRMYAIRGENAGILRVGVFEDMTEAELWLDQQEPGGRRD